MNILVERDPGHQIRDRSRVRPLTAAGGGRHCRLVPSTQSHAHAGPEDRSAGRPESLPHPAWIASQALIAPSTSCGPTSSDARKPACMLQLPACAGSVYVPRCLNLSDTRISTPHRERACDPHPSDTERGSARSDARKHGRGRAGRRTRGPCHSKGYGCRQPCCGHGLSTAVVPDTPLRAAGSPPAASRPLYSLMDLTLINQAISAAYLDTVSIRRDI